MVLGVRPVHTDGRMYDLREGTEEGVGGGWGETLIATFNVTVLPTG